MWVSLGVLCSTRPLVSLCCRFLVASFWDALLFSAYNFPLFETGPTTAYTSYTQHYTLPAIPLGLPKDLTLHTPTTRAVALLVARMPLVFPAPPISLSTAHAFAAFFTFSYIGSLYVSKNARLSFKNGVSVNVRDGEERAKQADERWRNDPDVIRARLFAASMSTVGSLLAVYWLVGSVIPEDEVCTTRCQIAFSRVS